MLVFVIISLKHLASDSPELFLNEYVSAICSLVLAHTGWVIVNEKISIYCQIHWNSRVCNGFRFMHGQPNACPSSLPFCHNDRTRITNDHYGVSNAATAASIFSGKSA